ncbi:hypothetical protein [Pseudoxanthomonas sp.]|uniref:hypothetical protein n=1 Tax=Pseudoxanthomonas sp. TaxID=1871049 RepID=UPI0025D6C70B|nr:hypothetical protein [Pseudoxanthomonas sp.]
MTTENPLSFTELDRRLRDMPDGPAAILDTPPPYRIANLIGGVAAFLTFVPFILIQFMPPERWMVVWAQVGFSVFLLALLPGLARSYGVLGWTLWTWRADQVSQLDHDLPQFRTLLAWLSAQPQHALAEHQRVARLTLAQISVRIGMFTGGLERLGVLPVLVSAWLFLRNWKDLLDMPLWQLLLGFGLMLFYIVMTVGNLKRIRLQLYESLLAEALAMKAASGTAP